MYSWRMRMSPNWPMALNVFAAAVGMVLQWVVGDSGEVGSGNSEFLSHTYIVRDYGCDYQAERPVCF